MFRVRVLGSGDAFNAGGALHSAYLLEHDGGKILLECGPSTLAGLKRNGVPPDEIDAVLVSHLHGDHFGGVPFLLLDYLFCSYRDRPFVIAGPPSTRARITSLYANLYKEEHFQRMPFELRERAVSPGDSFELAGLRVEAFRVPHEAEPFCLGYRISAGRHSMLFSGDSAWSEEFVHRSQSTDLFLCECCSMKPETDFHTSYDDILANRDKLGCKRLVLTHLGTDVRAAKKLEVERAFDDMVIEFD